MNGYLVLLRHTMDDLPIGLYADRDEALLECGRIGGSPDNGMPTKEIRDVYETDCSTPVSVCVVRFVNGKPVEVIGSIAFDS
jgi:hypothetical protein